MNKVFNQENNKALVAAAITTLVVAILGGYGIAVSEEVERSMVVLLSALFSLPVVAGWVVWRVPNKPPDDDAA